MKLNTSEENTVHDYIMGEIESFPASFDNVLEKIELGVFTENPIEFEASSESVVPGSLFQSFTLKPTTKALMIFTQDAGLARNLLEAFKLGALDTLTVRVKRSWRCYINCGDKIIEKTCEEDKPSTESCCEELRQQC